jgi:hypothetical protein
MKEATGRLVRLAVFSLLVVACNPDSTPVGPIPSAFDRQSEEFSAPLVQHIVAPQATDPAIDRFLDNHYVWLDTTAQSNHKLLVFMPGFGQRPAIFQLVQQEAARLGYHVVGLMYSNGVRIGAVCPSTPDPVACYEQARLETIDGTDRTPVVDVSPTNSIDNRLTKLLEYLAAQYPDEGWSQFLADGAPNWPLIAVAGHSLGGGEGAMIGKIRLVARVVMFSAVNDTVSGGASPLWVAPHVTPLERYYGIAHDRDPTGFAAIRASWAAIGLEAFGLAVAPETNEPPYGWTHTLVTDLTPQGGFVGLNAHGAPSNDLNTPLAADGTPLLRDAWDYLLTGRPRRPGLGEQVAEVGSRGGAMSRQPNVNP